MAYAAVTCLRSTIMRLLSCSRTYFAPSTQRNLEAEYKEIGSLQELLKKSGGGSSSSSWLNDLDGQIAVAAQDLEDSLEFYELEPDQISRDVELLDAIISSSVQNLKNSKLEFCKELGKSLPKKEDKEGEDEGAEGNAFSWNMVGLSNEFDQIKLNLVGKHTYIFSIVGMAGIGKTALAKRLLHDEHIMENFECRALVRVGQNYKLEELKEAILDQVNPNSEKHETLDEYLDDKRYLIVLDDVWDLGFWDHYFQDRQDGDEANGSCIMLTTRLEHLVLSLSGAYFYMPFLTNEESWDLVHGKVFSEKVCPLRLENAGKEIAEKCDGLPLMLVTVADILSKANDTTREYWKKAAHRKSRVFQSAYDQILQVLYPSYYNLPPQAKVCFLYMAAFPPNHQVRRSKLVNMWCSEGFLEPNDSTPARSFASECFDEHALHHVVVPASQLSSDGQNYQACSLHSVFRHLCKKELESNGFLHIIQSPQDGLTLGNSRRVAVYYNVLLSIKEMYTSIGSSPAARSLLCTGAYHKYEVRVNFTLKLLRVCDVLTIRFYEFPMKVLELLQLTYFAITCNQNLPSSIYKLRKLEYLIVHQHLNTNFTLAESFLPVEVWKLQELIHLQIRGRNLPSPPHNDVALPKLVTLLDVGIDSCSEGVLRSVPNLNKLRVQIQLKPNSVEPLTNLVNISQLTGLLSLQCLILNPILMPQNVDHTPSFSVSQSCITKLTLSGLGYHWAYLNKAFKLPNLKVLKLLQYAFRGNKWDVEEDEFLTLECLSIEDNDLVQWKAGKGSFPGLSYLNLTSCYKLQQLPGEMPSLVQIELVDCNPAAATWADQKHCYATSSWDDHAARDNKNYICAIYSTI